MDVWFDIPEFEGRYQVSRSGKVRGTFASKRILKGSIDSKGYLFFTFWFKGKPHQRRFHRIFAEAFLPNPQNKPYIDHIDGNPLNNALENLRWVTQKENLNNPVFKERSRIAHLGKIPTNSKKVQLEDSNGNVICYFKSLRMAAECTGLDVRTIRKGFITNLFTIKVL